MTAHILTEPVRRLLDSLDTGIHILDHTGHSSFYNQKMAAIEGLHPEDVTGRYIMDIFNFSSEADSRLLQALHHGRSTKAAQQTYFTYQGKAITTVNDTFPLYEHGCIIGAAETARDVTALKQASSRRRQRPFTFQDVIGTSPGITRAVETAQKAAATSSTVLIDGETGTGKEVFAQSIHYGSRRAPHPFISQNCSALPEQLVESLFFGTRRGAFTEAQDHPGLFEQAEGGTLFLDEIHTLPFHLQAKLLRVLQEKTIKRLGDTKEKPVDVRIIAAMNLDPQEALEQRQLRSDLYYRLRVVSLSIPPLRERKEDIPAFTSAFIEKYNDAFQMQVPGITGGAEELLYAGTFPGNVRELEHMIEGAMNINNGREPIEEAHLPVPGRRYSSTAPPAAPIMEQPLTVFLEDQEQQYVAQALERHSGNITHTAEALGLSRQSLQYRMKKHGLSG
ncbi:sigma-54 interaction domain-containing protein [Alkalicoccus chagannorensis]|uniref:sigma-54 interaction domain-containing protein n=1 Tax=Alkalicoccus chagannorensis TaxID=427072 RepID=UPI00040F26A7|nr:sigma-54-dependent Fis family transcriptional regulator [Alkalicoccus chagannorensis]